MMQKVLVFLAVACFSAIESSPDKSKWIPFVCRQNGILAPVDDIQVKIQACGWGKCYFNCQAGVLGLLDSDGTTSLDIYREWVQAVLPEEHQEHATNFFSDCFEKYGRHIDISDRSCTASRQFADCTWKLQSLLTCTYQ